MPESVHSPEYRRLRDALVRIRNDAGLSQRALARILRVPHSWVAKVESGERRIDLIEFIWVCDACDAKAEEIVAEITNRKTRRKSRHA